jgi:hypothetical protein
VIGRGSWRVAVLAAATAVSGSAVAVAVNLATEFKTNFWAWVAVVVATALVAAVAMWLDHRRNAEAAPLSLDHGRSKIKMSGSAL